MTYEESMKWKSHRYDFQTNQYIAEDNSYLDMPMSKCPIKIKIIRAIQEKKSFNNLGSTVATAIRWVGDFYVVSVREYTQAEKWEDIDIAVGRQGEVPFAFRSPHRFDPTGSTRMVPSYEPDPVTKKYKFVWKETPSTPKEMYSYAFDASIVTRLDQLGIYITRRKTTIRSEINPKTKRKNKIYASVGCYHRHADCKVFPIWQSVFDHLEEKCLPLRPLEYIPLLKMGWYLRVGIPCENPTAPIINTNTNTKANA